MKRLAVFLVIALVAGCKVVEENNSNMKPLTLSKRLALRDFAEDLNHALMAAADHHFVLPTNNKNLPTHISTVVHSCERDEQNKTVGPARCPFYSQWKSQYVSSGVEKFSLEMNVTDHRSQLFGDITRIVIDNGLRVQKSQFGVESSLRGLVVRRGKDMIEFNATYSSTNNSITDYNYTFEMKMDGIFIQGHYSSDTPEQGVVNGVSFPIDEFENLIPILRFD